MKRQPACGETQARSRAKVARIYLDIAQLTAGEQDDASRNVAAGNAVLAGIAAADAICCVHLGKRSRGQDHREAVSLLQAVSPNGQKLAADLATVLAVKDPAHYGDTLIGATKLKTTVRAATRLVEASETSVTKR